MDDYLIIAITLMEIYCVGNAGSGAEMRDRGGLMGVLQDLCGAKRQEYDGVWR